MNLGLLIKNLEVADPEHRVYFDKYRLCVTGCIHSYRGYYEDLALGFSVEGSGVKASDLLRTLQAASGSTFTGYKGGEYKMGLHTRIWAANCGDTTRAEIIAVGMDDNEVTLFTTQHDV